MKAYSLDLRTKILTAYQHDEGSIRQLAQRFKVSPRFVGQLVVCCRRTGRCAPTPHGGGNPPCIARSQYSSLSGLVQAHPDATLKEWCCLLEDREPVAASTSSLQRTLATRQLTRKKRRAMRQNALPQRSKRKPRQNRLCWLTLCDCPSFKVFFLYYTT
jgi:transposase